MIARTVALYKNSFTGLSPQTWLLSMIMLVNRSGTMVVPFMTLYLTGPDMKRSLSEAGVVMGLFGLGSVVGAYFGGRFSDRIGFYKIQLITLLFGGLMFIVLGQIRSFPLICVFTFLLSLVNEAFRPANSSAIAFYSKPENRTRSYSLNRLAVNLGWAVGTSLGGFLASRNYALLFWVDGLTNISAAVLMIIFLKQGAASKAHASQRKEMPVLISAYKDKTYLIFIFLVSVFAFCFYQIFTTIPKHFRDDMHLSEQYIGLIMAVNGLIIVAVEMILVYKLEGRKTSLHYIIIGVFISALAFFILLIPGNSKLISFTMIMFLTVGEIMAMPFMNSYWTSRSNENNRGQYAALYTIAWGVAQSLGPFFCSLLVDHSSFTVLFIVLGSVTTLAAFGFYQLQKKQ